MIKPASLQSSYSLIWSHDPSLNLETYTDDDKLGAEQNAEARAKVEKERARLLRVAQQTGNWHAITKPGEVPTVFTFRQLGHNDLAWVHGEASRSQLGQLEINDLFFLLALEGVSNFGTIEVKRQKGQRLANSKVLDELSAALNSVIPDGCAQLVAEFVEHIVARARGALDPL